MFHKFCETLWRHIMQTLSRKWRKSRDVVDPDGFFIPTRDDSLPIDTQDQEELVRSLEKIQADQSLRWRRVFSGFVSGYAVFLVYSICQQASSPWDLRYHAYFMHEIDSGSLVAAEGATVLVCLMIIAGLMQKSRHQHRWLWYSFVPSTMLALFWLHHMLRLTKFRWDIIWLPLTPLGAAGICLYVDHLLNVSSEEVKKLRDYMYAYKSY